MKIRSWKFRRIGQFLAIWSLGVVPAFIGLPVFAQTEVDKEITTLPQLFANFWRRQPDALGAASRRLAADARRSVAQSWTAEPIALELSIKTDQLTQNQGNREHVIGAAALLWLPGERSRAQAVAQSERDLIDSRVSAAQWRAAAVVRDAWWAAHRAGLDVALAQVRLGNTRQLAADVARRVKAGDLSRADQHQIDAAVAAAQAVLAEALSMQTQTRQMLGALASGTLAEVLSDTPEAVPVAGEANINLSAHPVLRELADRVHVAQRNHELVAVQTRTNPELNFAVTSSRAVFGEAYGRSLSLGARIPFGSDARSDAKKALARAELIEAESLLQVEQGRLAADIEAAQTRVARMVEIVEAAEKRAVLARELRGFFEKSFQLGESDLPARLRVETDAFEADRQMARARIDLAQAVSQWRQAQGLFPE